MAKAQKPVQRYAGQHSARFWKYVKSFHDERLYIAACALQDAEQRMFQDFAEIEREYGKQHD